MCLNYCLTQLLELPLSDNPVENQQQPQIVVLCGDGIQSKEVWETIKYLNIKPYLFDDATTESSAGPQEANLKKRMEDAGGILVTHNRLFAGMEVDTVVSITMTLGANEAAERISSIMRDETKLIVITNRKNTQVEDAEQQFNVIELPDISEVSDDE